MLIADTALNTMFPDLTAAYTRDEAATLKDLVAQTKLNETDRTDISKAALGLVATLRSDGQPVPLMDALLQEYGLSTEEGVALMRLSEALIRTPDFATSRKLVRDKLIDADWRDHAGQAPDFLVNQATNGLRLSAGWIKASGGIAATNIAAKLGDRVLGLAMNRVMAVMAEHFVLGRSIEDAAKNARKGEAEGQTYSYDMLGEAALTQEDADTYFEAYKHAVTHLATKSGAYKSIAQAPGISVKLSALHPRYEYATRQTCAPLLIDRLTTLGKIAKSGGLSLAIDAEETDRLELSLIIFKALLNTPELANWDGLGLVVQSYQRRAIPALNRVIDATRKAGRKITIRLVKGAYWDSEIKRAQELGLESYPVFTRKENTDVSYLACARLLLDAGDVIFPQFATHNAHTAAAITHMAGENQPLEIQRLHGMGKKLHEALTDQFALRSRVYAPVGAHEDLLPYLVRRLLENGANSSFVNQIFDKEVDADQLVADPISLATAHAQAANPKLPIPRAIAENGRLTAMGVDFTQADIAKRVEACTRLDTPFNMQPDFATSKTLTVRNPADLSQIVGSIGAHGVDDVERAIAIASGADWPNRPAPERAACLNRAADLLEAQTDDFLQLCVLEAGKSLPDAIAEVREAVDFCRYYASQALLPRIAGRDPLGVVACISPWNFPLAIFLGQITAALSLGNTVVAKPAEQTPLISYRAIALLKEAGVPADAMPLLIGNGAELGSALTRHQDVKAICFTGSTATAKRIAASLAETDRATIPFIAETGGINTMIVDSTALLEQAVKDVVASAFQSAGQRCSACRIVCVQEDIADDFVTMLTGAMDTLSLGNPARLATDIGPVIDAGARNMIETYLTEAGKTLKILNKISTGVFAAKGNFVSPAALEIKKISDVKKEIFGPVLHVLRFKSSELETLVAEINATGFGLTMGLHTRLDHRIEKVSAQAHTGNLYVNRNQIGAVVGTQPFGGEGLSGTGPKAGGPHYLLRLSQTTVYAVASSTSTVDKERVTSVQTLRSAFALTAIASDRLWQRATFPLEHTLPGPTGEQNTLKLHPRGNILCLGGNAEQALEKQIALALIAGNKVIAPKTDATAPLLDALQQALKTAGLADDTLETCTPEQVTDLLDGAIDGVAIDGDTRADIAKHLCTRDGAILPLLSAFDDPERFYHERTVTINTTAAGGNASLLAMS